MPLSRISRASPSVQTVTVPPGAYFTALESTCSTTKPSHFSSVSTSSEMGRRSRATLPRIKSWAYLRAAWRTMGSSFTRRMT